MHIIQTRKGTQATLEELKGLGYAQDMIERLKSTPYDDLVELDQSEDEATFKKLKIGKDELTKLPLENEPAEFNRTVSIEEFTQDFGGTKYKMKKIEVIVKWKVKNLDENNKWKSRQAHVKLNTIVRKLVN
jgi:hypothetical protein